MSTVASSISASSGLYDYRLSGLQLRSQIELPELTPSGGEIVADTIDIGFGTVPAKIDDATRIHEGYLVSPREALITPEKFKFHAADGRQIVIDQGMGKDPALLRFYLLGAAITAISFQRGLIPFHCGAIEIAGRAVMFCGYSRRGKSSLAAYLATRGHAYLSDDRLVLTDGPGGLSAVPGAPFMHLSAEAANHANLDPVRVFPGETPFGKRIYRANHLLAQEACPLGAVIVMDWDDGLQRPQFVEIDPFSALEEVRSQINYEGYVRAMGLEDRAFALAARIVREVPVFRLNRPRGFEHMAGVAQTLEGLAKW